MGEDFCIFVGHFFQPHVLQVAQIDLCHTGPRHVGTSSSQGADVLDGDTAADVVDSADAAAAIDMDLEMQKLLVARLPCREL